MLVPLYSGWLVLRTNADKARGNHQIIVVIVDVGKHVMHQIVGYLPVIGVGADEVKDRPESGVYHGVLRIRTVQGIMANIKSYKGREHSQYNSQGQQCKGSEVAQQNKQV